MSEPKEIKTSKEEFEEEKDVFKGVSFWLNRIKFDGALKYSYLIVTAVWIGIGVTFIVGFELYFIAQQYIVDLMIHVAYFYVVFMSSRLTKNFQNLIIENERIFETEAIFHKYIKTVNERFKSKTELILPLFMGIVFSITAFAALNLQGGLDTAVINNIEYTVPPGLEILNLFVSAVNMIGWFLIILLVVSALFLFNSTFKCLNMLGTDEFPLKVTYSDLKIGAFDDIGKFIISLSIPSILLSTFIGMVGVIYILVMDNLLYGYAFIIMGMGITLMLSFLLYKNTMSIHEAIQKFKLDLKMKLLNFIDVINSQPPGQMDMDLQYKLIYNIHDYYDRIDDVNDWPFNPTSIKKLLITLGSSFLPLVLSFIGFGG